MIKQEYIRRTIPSPDFFIKVKYRYETVRESDRGRVGEVAYASIALNGFSQQ